MVSILGAGLLVGAALAVIIPEGIQMLYSQQFQGIEFSTQSQHLLKLIFIAELKMKYEQTKATPVGHSESHDHEAESLHNVIGLALVLGFLFMLIVDYIGSSRMSRGNTFSMLCHL